MRLTFTVPGPPVPKARARVVTDERGTRGVTPAKTRTYEKHAGLCALASRLYCSAWPWKDKGARFGIAMRFYRSRDSGDLDNYEKGIQDACKGILWHDDGQIRRRGEGGIYDVDKGQERAEVEVWVL